EAILSRVDPIMRSFLEEIQVTAPDRESLDAAFLMVARLQEVRDRIAEKVPVAMDTPGMDLLHELQQLVIEGDRHGLQ
ncbi:hypothetical protein, partial [Acidithiobacillus sp.]|uniref:hypothetical protein n=1 Tax=Acidithiobacillus sp. TaxID=1872118 RepID=UPI003D040BC3